MKQRMRLIPAILLLLLAAGACRGAETGRLEQQPKEVAQTAEAKEEEPQPHRPEDGRPEILVNQNGYREADQKTAVFLAPEPGFEVVDTATGEVVHTGELLKDRAKSKTYFGDFSRVKAPGEYYIRTAKGVSSPAFLIGNQVYRDLPKQALVKLQALQDTGFREAALDGNGERLDVSGGWRQGSDDEKHVMISTQTIALLLLAYEYQDPEERDPFLLAQVRAETEWLLKMQDGNGGVYHKLSKDKLAPVSTAATAAFAGALAMFSEAGKEADAEYAGVCRRAAEAAWNYLENHPGIPYQDPEGMEGTEFGDGSDLDERYFAAAQLYKLTGSKKYQTAVENYITHETSSGLLPGEMGSFGTLAYLTTPEVADIELCSMLINQLLDEGISIADDAANDAYRISAGAAEGAKDKVRICTDGIIMIYTNKITPNEDCRRAIGSHINYLSGMNPEGKAEFSPEELGEYEAPYYAGLYFLMLSMQEQNQEE